MPPTRVVADRKWLPEPVAVSGSWALVIRQHGQPHSCITVEVDGECIERIFVMRNPRKLSTFTHA